MSKVLLAVLAHPDDESFGLGGTLALYSRRGVKTYLVCATRGEAGSVDEEQLEGYQDLASKRVAELACAASILGLSDVFYLGYRDSGMLGSMDNKHPDAQINHSVDEVAGCVVKFIRDLKPDVVLTFDPQGGYKHPDHIHIHHATVQAFKNADNPDFHPEAGLPFKPGALYFQVFPRWFLKVVARLLPYFGKDPSKWGKNGDINLTELADVSFPVHVKLNIREVATFKVKAGACHASQGSGLINRGWMGLVSRILGGSENYMRAYPPIKDCYKVGRDLFDGL
jgi:LmbE family N-acetylglucosaminyl deacetylase